MVARGPKFQIQAEGLRDIAAALADAPARMDKELRQANKRAMEKAVVPHVQRGAPRRSGNLAKSVRGLATAKRAQLAVGTPSKVPYAGPINFGWPARNIRPQEFIYAGIAKAEDQILDIYVEELDDVARKIAPHGKL